MNKEFILKRILTVEDDVTIRMNLVSYLEDSGYEVLEASNGSEGVRVFERERPDLVLVDLHMPELDGVSLLEQLRKLSSDTPLIVVSGASDIHEAISATQSGAWDFVLKPIRDMRELEHTISKAWERACLLKENHRYQRELEEQVQERTKKLNLAVQELGSSRELLANAERIAHLGSWSLEPQSGKMRWSEELYSLLGFNAQSTVPELAKLLEPVLGPDLPRLRQGFDLLIQQGLAFKLEHQIILPDGKNRVLLHQGEPGVHRPGTIDGVILDITERKEMEEQLRKSKELAEAASIAKNNFLATMSHELRTPLNGMVGTANLLSSTSLTPDQRELVEVIGSCSQSLTQVIGDILDLAKIQRGAMQTLDAPFDPTRELESLFHLFGPAAREKKLDLKLELGDLPPRLTGDAHKLGQICSNLVSNALKFTAQGKVRLKAKVARQTETQVWLEFEVTDTGVGIDPLVLPQIFKPFTQGDSSLRKAFQGAGLGLTLVRQLVGLMNGEISLASEMGKGTKVRFTLPFTAVAPAAVGPGGKKVLVLESDPVNRLVLGKWFESKGCLARLCETADQAQRLSKYEKFDLLLVDLIFNPTGEPGWYESLRPGNAEVPLVALTHLAGLVPQGQAGPRAYLVRPYTAQGLEATLAPFLGT